MLSKLGSGIMTQHQLAEAAFIHDIRDLIGQEMYGSIALSLLEYFNKNLNIIYVLNMFYENIDELNYTKSENRRNYT